ncbi:MAG: serine--tRNA ligase, partial [Candidatus Woesearchaeota archaeon]
MLDIKFVRAYPEIVKANLEKRHEHDKVRLVDELIRLDKEWRVLKQECDSFRQRRNSISEEINAAKKAGLDISKLIKEAAELPARIKATEEELKRLEEKIIWNLQRLPNIAHESVPVGMDSSENVEMRRWGI